MVVSRLDDPRYLKGWITEEAKESYKEMMLEVAALSNKTKESRKKKKWMRKMLEDCKTTPILDIENCKVDDFVGFLQSFRKKDGRTFLKPGAYQTKCSALGHLFSFHEETPNGLPTQFAKDLASLKKGFFRTIAKSAQDDGGGDGSLEGKRPMSEQLYKKCCQWFLEKGDSSSIFCHTFLVLTWNLMCRSNNTCRILFEHITWFSDNLEIQFAQTKNDNLGQRQKLFARRLYANPLDPSTCPLFALSLYLATFSGTSSARDPLFSGKAPYTRFMTGLHAILREHLDELQEMGYTDEKDIGSHSIRKGATTWLAGQPGGPPVAAICIRGGWTLGGVKDIYMTYQAEGDAFCGRMLAMLPLLQSEFAMGPPELADVEMIVLESHLESIFPALSQNSFVKPLLLRCLAALVCNRDHVLAWPPSHIVRQQNELFRDEAALSSLSTKCKVPSAFDVYKSSSGIPPHVIHTVELEKLRNDFHNFIENFKNSMHEVFDDRNVANGSMSRHQMREIVLETQQHLCDQIIARLSLGGANGGLLGQSQRLGQDSYRQNAVYDQYGWHYHPGADPQKPWRLPFGYTWPKGTAQNLWKVWNIGDTISRIPPLKYLEAKDFAFMKNDGNRPYRKVLHDLRYLCKYIDTIAEEKGHDISAISSSAEANRVFRSVATTENGLLDRNTSFARQIAWRTTANKIRTKMKKAPRSSGPATEGTAVDGETAAAHNEEEAVATQAPRRNPSRRTASRASSGRASSGGHEASRARTTQPITTDASEKPRRPKRKRMGPPADDDGRDFLAECPVPDVPLGRESREREAKRARERRYEQEAIEMAAEQARHNSRTTGNPDGTYTYNGGRSSSYPIGKCSCTRCVNPTHQLRNDTIHKCIWCKATIHIDCSIKLGADYCDPAKDEYTCGCRTADGRIK